MELLYTSINYVEFKNGDKPHVKFSARLSGNDAGFLKCVCFDTHIMVMLKNYSADDKYNIAGRLTNKKYTDASGKEQINAQLVIYGIERIFNNQESKKIFSKTSPFPPRDEDAVLMNEVLGSLDAQQMQQTPANIPVPNNDALVQPELVSSPRVAYTTKQVEPNNLDWLDDLDK